MEPTRWPTSRWVTTAWGIERTLWIAEADLRTPLDAHVRPGAAAT
jgi:hypothetical protein